MTVNYSVQPLAIPGQSGKHFLRVETKGTRTLEHITQNITSKTGIGSVDVSAVLQALMDEIVDAAMNGDAISIEGFLGITLSIESGAAITDPNHSFTAGSDRLALNAQVKSPLQERVRRLIPNASDFVKVASRVRQPQINRIFDVLSQQVGKFTPGGPVEITGSGLDLPSDLSTDTRNGVFFKNGPTETRATIYMSEGDTRIVCIVPISVSAGTVEVIVRSDYETATLHNGSLPGVLKSLAASPGSP